MSFDKVKRRERVQRAVEHRRERAMTYWVTRDRDADGLLSNRVDVWLLPPRRVQVGLGCHYACDDVLVPSGAGPVRVHFGTWTLGHCLREIRTCPDDDRQVIRVGDEPPPEPMAADEVVA